MTHRPHEYRDIWREMVPAVCERRDRETCSIQQTRPVAPSDCGWRWNTASAKPTFALTPQRHCEPVIEHHSAWFYVLAAVSIATGAALIAWAFYWAFFA